MLRYAWNARHLVPGVHTWQVLPAVTKHCVWPGVALVLGGRPFNPGSEPGRDLFPLGIHMGGELKCRLITKSPTSSARMAVQIDPLQRLCGVHGSDEGVSVAESTSTSLQRRSA
jgi:hypothetical protein